jgi:glycosyltransferase involved in cell wall biosynthesis
LPPDTRPRLVIVGKPTAYLQEVKKTIATLGIEKQVIFIHNATFQDLPAIYQGATLFTYPSLFEGFGIPIVEAIESGVPVLTSTGSCFAEAGGPHAKYANPLQPQQWTTMMQEMLVTDNSETIAKQKEHALKFRAEENKKALLNSYQF